MKIKILFAIGRFSVGGAEKLLVKKLDTIDNNQFEPYLLTLFPERTASYQEKIFLDQNHWKKMNFNSLFDIRSWIELFRFLKKEKFAVLVTALFSANLIVRFAAILVRIPVIISREHNLYPNKHRWQIFVDWFLSKWTDKIITDSEAARQFTAQQENIPLEKFLTMHAPPLVDKRESKSSESIRQELNLPKKSKVAVTISRLVSEKGHKYLIEAAQKVLQKFPNVYFLIVGWGPLESELKAMVQALKLQDHILFPGLFLGNADVKNILPVADIFVDPSTRTDMPFAIMEALSFGKPVVASAIGDIPIFIENNKTGFTVPPANSDALAEKILFLLQDDLARSNMGIAAFKKVELYSMENYMRVFENVVLDYYREKNVQQNH